MAEQSFRFYRNVHANDPMPIEANEHWQELKKNVEESMKTQHTQSDYKDLCNWFFPTLDYDRI